MKDWYACVDKYHRGGEKHQQQRALYGYATARGADASAEAMRRRPVARQHHAVRQRR